MRTAESRQASSPAAQAGWKLKRIAGPSRLWGANGITLLRDGRILVCSGAGRSVSAVNLKTGLITDVVTAGPGIGADDAVELPDGTLAITDPGRDRVCFFKDASIVREVASEKANGITCWRGRVFVTEMRAEGRLLEVFPDGRPLRVLADGIDFGNACAVGPGGWLYFPKVVAGQVWRCHVDDGRLEKVAEGFRAVTAVKLDTNGHILLSESPWGRIWDLDPQTERRELIGQVPGLVDSLETVGPREAIVSLVTGGLMAVGPGGVRELLPPGFVGPFDVVSTPEGEIFVADTFTVAPALRPNEPLDKAQLGRLPGSPTAITWHRGRFVVACESAGMLCSIEYGGRAAPLREGMKGPVSIATDGNALLVVEKGCGRVSRFEGDTISVIAEGLVDPLAVCSTPQGPAVALRTGEVMRFEAQEARPLVSGLQGPLGLTSYRGTTYALTRDGSLLALIPSGPEAMVTGLPVVFPSARGAGSVGMDATDEAIFIAAPGDGSVFALALG